MKHNTQRNRGISKESQKDIIVHILKGIQNGRISLVKQDHVLIQINISESYSVSEPEEIKKGVV